MTTSLSRPAPLGSATDFRDPVARIAQVLDRNSLHLLPAAPGSGVRAAIGRIDGDPAVAFCTDGSVLGGAMGSAGCAEIVAAIELALERGCPVVGIWHSGGARLAQGVESLQAVGSVFAAMVAASGRIPQLSVVVGPAAGGAAYGPALTDLVIMAPAGRIFVTGPDVVRSVTGEDIDMEGLGGTDAHGRRSGVAHVIADDEADAYRRARLLTGLLGRPGAVDRAAAVRPRPGLSTLLPDNPRRAYDVRPVVRELLDYDTTGRPGFEELQAKWAPNVVIGLGRLAGRTIGVIANNPLRKAGCLDSASAEKAARFVRMCDSFGVPLAVLVDVPGYLPGATQEWDGVVRRGAKLLHAFAEAVVPRATVVLRKSFGGAYLAMNSRALGATRVLAWPEAEVAVMGASAAVDVLYRKQLAAAPDGDREQLREEFIREQERTAGGVTRAMEIGAVDEIVAPGDTRRALADVFAHALPVRGKHTNIPL